MTIRRLKMTVQKTLELERTGELLRTMPNSFVGARQQNRTNSNTPPL